MCYVNGKPPSGHPAIAELARKNHPEVKIPQRIKKNKNRRYRAVMNHEKRSITRTESQGKGRGITIKVVSLKPRPLDAQLIVKITHVRQMPSQVRLGWKHTRPTIHERLSA